MNKDSIEAIYRLYLDNGQQIQTDTRKIKEGDIFFALKGEHFDGNEFAEKALALGASAVVIDNPGKVFSDKCILVSDVLQSLQALARHHRLSSKAKIVAITGSNGKTTTKELVHAVLKTQYRTIATVGNLNNHIGVPLTLLSIKSDTEIAIVEMGANHIGEIASYCQWALPDYGLITNIGKAHLEGFGGLEGVKQGKGELFQAVKQRQGTLCLWTDAPVLSELAGDYAPVISYGTQDGAAVQARLIEGPLLSFEIMQPSSLAGEYHTHLVGSYNLPNALSAIALGHHFGITQHHIQQALSAYEPDNSRSQALALGSNHIILDAYNANPTSMKEAIDNFRKVQAPRKVVLLGCMKEMGDQESIEHQAIVSLLSSHGFTEVYLVGQEYQGLSGTYPLYDDSESLREFLTNHPITDAHILIKGSRGAKMERVLDALRG